MLCYLVQLSHGFVLSPVYKGKEPEIIFSKTQHTMVYSGVVQSHTLTFKPASFACCAIFATRVLRAVSHDGDE